ncbi:MAG: SIS domain-containing protein [Clostridia bacterium]|nr:SIS domain-containing protein [Clostridia bacterium]
MLALNYLDSVKQILSKVGETQLQAIEEAASVVAETIKNGGRLHLFGTGHSHIIAEEAFYRAGGLVQVNAILEPALMLHDGPFKSTAMERLEGYAQIILDHSGICPGDVLMIISNSGRNSVPVEMALAAKAEKIPVIALTSLAHSKSVPSRHSSGKRLFEVADIVIDNCGVPGDAVLSVNGSSTQVCPTSTVVGAAIINMLEAEIVERLCALGIKPSLFVSANMDGGDEFDRQWVHVLERVPTDGAHVRPQEGESVGAEN